MALKTNVEKPKSGNEFDQHLKSKPAHGTVSVETKTGGDQFVGSTSESQVVVPGLFESNGMSIGVEASRTLNLGNFNSARIGVTLTVPCHPSTMNEAYEFALNWCGERVAQAVADAKGA